MAEAQTAAAAWRSEPCGASRSACMGARGRAFSAASIKRVSWTGAAVLEWAREGGKAGMMLIRVFVDTICSSLLGVRRITSRDRSSVRCSTVRELPGAGSGRPWSRSRAQASGNTLR